MRHICADGLLSQPSPSFGCLKLRPMMSVNSSSSTTTSGFEGIDVMDRDHPRGHVPFVVAGPLVFFLDVGVRPVIGAEILDVGFGIGVADQLVRIEAQCLMGADRPGDFLVDIGRHHLGAPIAVIGANKADDPDVVDQAGENDLLVHAGPDRVPGALQQMVRRPEPVFEKVHQGRFLGHLGKARVVAHQHVFPGICRQQRRAVRDAHIAVGELEQTRFDDDGVEFAHHPVLERVGALGQSHRVVHFRDPF